MSETSSEYCRICLSTGKDNNIADSNNYLKIFIHFMGIKSLKTLSLCMWCRATLKRTQELFEVALQSQEILDSQNKKLLENTAPTSRHCFSQPVHFDMFPDIIQNEDGEILIYNIDGTDTENVNDNQLVYVTDSDEIEQVYIQNELTNDNLNELYIVNEARDSLNEAHLQNETNSNLNEVYEQSEVINENQDAVSIVPVQNKSMNENLNEVYVQNDNENIDAVSVENVSNGHQNEVHIQNEPTNDNLNVVLIQKEAIQDLNEVHTQNETNQDLNEVQKQNVTNLNELIIQNNFKNGFKKIGNVEIEYIDQNINKSDLNKANNSANLSKKNEMTSEELQKLIEAKTKLETKMKERRNVELQLEEMKFEMKLLSIEEQKEEINKKRQSITEKSNWCEPCGISFTTLDYLENHEFFHTPAAGAYQCGVCELRFTKTMALTQHRLLHMRRFICKICGAKVNKWSNCSVHRQKCGGPVVIGKCDVCDKIFYNAHSLKVHRSIHTQEKSFKCGTCQKGFTTKQKKEVHERSHMNADKRPFKCDICPRTFTTESNLRAHKVVHEIQRRFYCVQCDKHFKSQKSFKAHIAQNKEHRGERMDKFGCEYCNSRFRNKIHLDKHKLMSTPTAQKPLSQVFKDMYL